MAPEERRRAIVSATLPLLEHHGAAVTTRQIADAAGIAEGTIFRVFPDKETLMRESIASAFDFADVVAKLDTIDRSLPLPERMLQIVGQLAARLERIFHLMMLLRTFPPETPDGPRRGLDDDPVFAKVVELLEPDAAAFRTDLPTVVRHLRLAVFAGTHPRISNEAPMAAAEMVDLFLYGSLQSTYRPGEC